MTRLSFIGQLSFVDRFAFLLGSLLNRMTPGRYHRVRMQRSEWILAKKKGFDLVRKLGQWEVSSNTQKFMLRSQGSDWQVFVQVILEEQYAPVVALTNINDWNVETVIDAGANIGLASIYFMNHFPQASIYAIEPDDRNFEMLNANTLQHIKVRRFQNAIWSSNTDLVSSDTFRDGQDWSRSFGQEVKANGTRVRARTLDSMVEEYGIKRIDILKIDVEGAEAELFSKNAPVQFLGITKVIAMEIHEEVVTRSVIHDFLKSHGFAILSMQGEVTIACNLALVK